MHLRQVALDLPGSLIRSIANAAMDTPGLIPLWFGESDLPTPQPIVQAASSSLLAGETRYGPNLGLVELRKALAEYQRTQFATRAGFDNIAVTSSGLNAILLALSALVDPDDEVIVPVPAWPNLVAMPKVLNASVREISLRLEDGRFVLPIEDILAACTQRTKALILNSPHNPTGWRMSKSDMTRLVAELDARGIWLIADEVYARLIPQSSNLLSFLDYFDEKRRIIIVNSWSKSWAMTGWRLGWITAPAQVIKVLERLIEFNTSCAPVFVQRGGIQALGPEGEAFVIAQARRLEQSRLVACAILAQDPRITIPQIDGAFYLFPKIEGLSDGTALAHRAIAHGVGIAPGEAFGEQGRGYVRLCYARAPDVMADAMQRFLRALQN